MNKFVSAEIKNLKKLAARILKAMAEKERVVLYVDADLDGTVATILIKEAMENLGGAVSRIFFSDRRHEEPGLNQIALDALKDQSPGLLLVLDCGISNFEEIKVAKKMGFDVVLLEHHEVLGRLPEASIIVDPKQEKKGSKNESYYDLAAAGLAFKLVEILLGKKLTGKLREDFLELTALATVADMVPEVGENVQIIEEGLPLLENSWRPGLKVLFESSLAKRYVSTREIVQKIISIINITDKEGELGELYLLLTARTKEEAQMRFERFLQKGSERQVAIERWFAEFKKQVSPKIDQAIIFEGSQDLPQPLLGTICSRLCDFFEKPAFLYKETEKENIGHYRTPQGVSGLKALASCSGLLRRYGGHGPAGGFYFQEKDAKKLEKCLVKYFKKSA